MSKNKKKEILMQPNNLIKGKYAFSSIDNKLFYKMLYNAQKTNDKNSLMETELTLQEIQEIVRSNECNTAEKIKEKLEMFQQMIIRFEYIEEETGSLVQFSSSIINAHKYYENDYLFKIQLHEEVYKQITDTLKLQNRGYSAINLGILFQFKGAYTQRLYALFRLWSRKDKQTEAKFTLNELREYLGMTEEQYPAYKNFKQKVLSKSLDEINKTGNMDAVLSEEVKKGRKVDTLIFTITDHEPRRYFDTEDIIDVIPKSEQDGLLESDKIKEEIAELSKSINTDNIPPMFTSDELTLKFLKYLNEKGISMNDYWEIDLLNSSCEAYTKNKGIYVVSNNTNYKYFIAIMENKFNDFINKKIKEEGFPI